MRRDRPRTHGTRVLGTEDVAAGCLLLQQYGAVECRTAVARRMAGRQVHARVLRHVYQRAEDAPVPGQCRVHANAGTRVSGVVRTATVWRAQAVPFCERISMGAIAAEAAEAL